MNNSHSISELRGPGLSAEGAPIRPAAPPGLGPRDRGLCQAAVAEICRRRCLIFWQGIFPTDGCVYC